MPMGNMHKERNSTQMLWIAFSTILIIIVVSVIFSINRFDRLSNSLDKIIHNEHASVEFLHNMHNAVTTRSVLLYNIAATPDPFDRDEKLQEYIRLEYEFKSNMGKLQHLSLDNAELELYQMIINTSQENYLINNQVIELLSSSNTKEAIDLVNTQSIPVMKKVLALIDTLIAYEINESHETDNKLTAESWESRYLMIISAVAVSFLVGLIFWTIDRRIFKLINNLTLTATTLRDSNNNLELMRESLKKHNDELEECVAARTKELELLVNTDSLTGIFNRRKFNESLQQELLRANRHSSAIGMIILDIDHFKSINDTYGHPRGDAVLKQMADIVSSSVRATDVFARWGGEEFVILVVGNNDIDPSQLAEKLRVKIEASDFDEVGHITCSFGVTTYIEGDVQESIVHRADECLYKAKKNGRNQVCFK